MGLRSASPSLMDGLGGSKKHYYCMLMYHSAYKYIKGTGFRRKICGIMYLVNIGMLVRS